MLYVVTKFLPDNANVCRPPAATVAILTPGLNATKQGKAERGSSPEDELSTACLFDDTRLLFVLSSPTALPSTPLDLDPPERGLSIVPCSVKNGFCLSNMSFSWL